MKLRCTVVKLRFVFSSFEYIEEPVGEIWLQMKVGEMSLSVARFCREGTFWRVETYN